MGLCWSYNRARKPRTGEREPLLPKTNGQENLLPPPQNSFERAADILAALKAGKLPSQDQLTRLAIVLSESDLLLLDNTRKGSLSQDGRRTLADVKELLDSFVQWGMEKNYDDTLQELFYSTIHRDIPAPVQVDVSDIAEGAPSPSEVVEDVSALSQSIRVVLLHTFTTSAFRLILSDLLFTLREVTVDVASNVETMAHQVEIVAQGAEDAATAAVSLDDVKGKAREISQNVAEAGREGKNMDQIHLDEVSRAKAVVIERLQQALAQAHENPRHRAALLTILSLVEKYSSYKLSPSAPHLSLSSEFASYLSGIQILLERSASGRSLDPLFRVLSTTSTDVAQNPSSELHKYLQRLGTFIRLALSQPGYVASANFRRDAEGMYDSARALLTNEQNAAWARDIRALVAESAAFVESMETDPSTLRVIKALSNLFNSVDTFIHGVGRQKEKWKEDLRRDIVTWVIPRLLRLFKTLPMPRVEILTPKLEGAVDSLYFSLQSGLTPDKMVLQTWNEVIVDFENEEAAQVSSRIKLHLEGIKLEADNIGYYLKYKNIAGIPGIHYSDEGLLSVSSGQGLSVDVDLDAGAHTSTTSTYTDLIPLVQNGHGHETDSTDPLFNVLDVRVSIPGLFIQFDRTKHWLLNKLLVQPVSGPAVRLAAGSVASTQLRTLLEQVAQIGGEVLKDAERRRDERLGTTTGEYPSSHDWWSALLEKGPLLFSSPEGEDQDAEEEEEEDVPVESHTMATSKGIVHISTTEPNTEESEETVIAVGAGAQLFPNKGGPYDDENKNETLVDVAKDVEQEVVIGASTAMEQAQQELNKVLEIRAQVEVAGERADAREAMERRSRKKGWRSAAFDI